MICLLQDLQKILKDEDAFRKAFDAERGVEHGSTVWKVLSKQVKLKW